MVKITQEGVGFHWGHFKDWNDKPCGISLSSLADDRCIWLGPIGPSSMMLLNVEQVAELLPVLDRFVKTGDIAESNG